MRRTHFFSALSPAFFIVMLAVVFMSLFSFQAKSEAKPYESKPQKQSNKLTMPLNTPQQLTRQDFQQVTWMEEALLATTYPKAALGERLARLETLVYGDALFSLSPSERIRTLHFTLMERQRVSTIETGSKAVKNTKGCCSTKGVKTPDNLEQDDSVAEKSLPNKPKKAESSSPSLPEKVESDYPVVALIENKLFGQPDPKSALSERLNRLDTRVFGRPQRGSYMERVDNLRLVVLGDTGGSGYFPSAAQTQPKVQNASYFPGIPPRYSYQGTASGSSPQATPPVFTTHGQAPSLPQQTQTSAHTAFDNMLLQAEQTVLNRSFPAEPSGQRLDRLEVSLFGRVAPPEISEQDRLDRILAVASAEGQATSDRDQILSFPSGTTTTGRTTKGGAKSLWPLIPMIILMLL